MSKAFRPSELVSDGLDVESAVLDGTCTVATVRGLKAASGCPAGGGSAGRTHSRYLRTLLDLPFGGRVVSLVFMVRRFRSDAARCSQRIFTERFCGEILRPWGCRTARVDDLVHQLGLAPVEGQRRGGAGTSATGP